MTRGGVGVGVIMLMTSWMIRGLALHRQQLIIGSIVEHWFLFENRDGYESDAAADDDVVCIDDDDDDDKDYNDNAGGDDDEDEEKDEGVDDDDDNDDDKDVDIDNKTTLIMVTNTHLVPCRCTFTEGCMYFIHALTTSNCGWPLFSDCLHNYYR